MEVALSGPQIPSEPLRRGTPLPLGQLVEETRNRANIPNHLLQSKIYAKLKSNSLIQAEPPVLHFSGFELEKDYIKILKLINISSEVMNIHIIPTQTKHFQTSYDKKYRLIPGLAYTLKVRFRPDEWRYFYDCIRVHCKGEENLLVPVHAYPVIDDLHIPSRIDLSAVALGQSVRHVIPLRCSCPTDFEFEVNVIQPHEAFSIHPLTGVIPASGEVVVTFSPFHYETSQVTIQLIINLCTITGSCLPHLALNFRPGPNPEADACFTAGVAKMLIKDGDKISSKHLREAISCGSMVGLQNRRMKDAFCTKKASAKCEGRASQPGPMACDGTPHCFLTLFRQAARKALGNLVTAAVYPTDVTVTTRIPFFNL